MHTRIIERPRRAARRGGRLALLALALACGAAAAEPPRPAAPAPARAPRKLQKDDFVAFMGGATTAARAYTTQMEAYLVACRPVPGLRTMQFGCASFNGSEGILGACEGNTGPGPFHPDVATMFYVPQTPDAPPQEYADQVRRLIARFKGSGARFVAVTAGLSTPEQRAAAREAAVREGGVFADFAATLSNVAVKARNQYGPEYDLAGGTRPAGGLVIAHALLKALGCDGQIGTITVDLASASASATEGHRVLAYRDGIVDLESTRYPFCFLGATNSPDATTGVVDFFPFNQDLNRFVLKVKGVQNGRMRVTWGDSSREFPSAALERGINLAAEFPVNPFHEPFRKMMDKIRDKQLYESQLFIYVGSTNAPAAPATDTGLPDAARNWDNLVALGVKCMKDRQEEVAEAVVPVQHAIRLELVPPAPR